MNSKKYIKYGYSKVKVIKHFISFMDFLKTKKLLSDFGENIKDKDIKKGFKILPEYLLQQE